MKFNNQKYTYSKPFSAVQHRWEIVGGKAAIHFNVSLYENDAACGLEFHYFEPPEYMKDEAPSFVNCTIAGGRCWHDGTSLYASETLWPIIKIYLKDGNHDEIFKVLQSEYESKFNYEASK